MATATETLTAAPSRPRSRPSNNDTRFWLTVVVLGVPTLYLVAQMLQKPTVLERAYAAAWMVFLAFLGLLLLLTRHHGGLLGMVTGADNRYSTSKLQTGLWTLAIGFGLALLTALSVFGDIDASRLFGSNLKEEYLVLLGGPFGAALLAKGVVKRKVAEGQLQKYAALAPSPLDVAADDDGNLDLVDMQYLLFNMIALAYFLAKLLPDPAQGLPDIPATVLGLTTTATAGYLGNKVLETNGPVLTSILPKTVHAAEEIAIQGRNLFPSGSEQVPAVLFNGLTSSEVTTSPEGIVKAIVPPGVEPGTVEVTVVTPAGIETEPRMIKVADVVPAIPEVVPVPLPDLSAVPAVVNRAGYPTPRDNAGDTDGDDDDHGIPAELLGIVRNATGIGGQL